MSPRSWERQREVRRARKELQRRRAIEREAAKRTAFRGRDEHTGGYGSPTYPTPDEQAPEKR